MTERVVLASLLKMELPGHTVRLIDAGTLTVDAETYAGRDDIIGVPTGFEAMAEGVGDEAPAGSFTFAPPDGVSALTLNNPANQGARMRLWIADVDPDYGTCIGAPDQIADWILDHSVLTVGREKRSLETTCVSNGQRVMSVDTGNSLSPTFHRTIYTDEAGLDNASGVSTTVAWGTASAPRGSSSA